MRYLSRAPFGPGRRMMFWEPARGHYAARLGQAAYRDPSNRLLEQSIVNILKRRAMVVNGPEAIYQAGWPGKVDVSVNPGWVNTAEEAAGFASMVNQAKAELFTRSPLPPMATQAFFDISQDPASQEIDDSDQIDAFFGPTGITPNKELESQIGGRPYPDPWITQPCLDGVIYPGHQYGEFREVRSQRTNPNARDFNIAEPVDMKGRFWCSPWANGKVNDDIPSPVRYAWDAPSPGGLSEESIRAHFYGLSLNEPWGDVKPWMKNALLADYVLARYPFPAPFGEYTRFWSYYALPGFRALIKSGAPLEEEDIRVWITFSVLTHYSQMVDALNDYLKSQARSARKDMIAKVIGVAVVALLVGWALGPAIAPIVSGIANSAASAMNKVDAHKLQQDMASIQDAFKEGDPAFAAQVGEASAYVQRLASAVETAVDKEHVTRTLQSTTLSTGLMIGGGLAAIGALALAIFRK